MDTAEFLRARGIRPSQQRLRIYERLASAETHPSAESLYAELAPEMPTLSRTTVFSALDLFARAGLALRLPITGAENRYDADTSPHAHFYCRACRVVVDLPRLAMPEPVKLPRGFIVESSKFFLEGLCPACGRSR